MAIRTWLRAIATSRLGKWLTPIFGWAFIHLDEYLFDDYLYGNLTVWCNNTLVRIVSPMIGEGDPFWWGRTAGAIAAFLLIAPSAALMCWLWLRWYDYWGIDWLGFETMKEFDPNRKHGWWTKFRLWVMSWGEVPSLIVLSIWKDAFVTTVVLRKRENLYGGLTKRDWGIFRASVLISVGYWSLRWSALTLFIQYLFPYLPPWLQQGMLWVWHLNLSILEWMTGFFVNIGQTLAEWFMLFVNLVLGA